MISAYKIFTRSIYDLLDGALEENIQLMIMRELAVHFDKNRDFHGVRSRRVGSRVFIELFWNLNLTVLWGRYRTVLKILKVGWKKY